MTKFNYKSWSSSIIIACLLLLAIMLSLGSLLNTNEQQNQAYVDEQQQQAKSQIQHQPANNEAITEILRQHLVCYSDDQCTSVNSFSSQLNCYVAVNKIGASMIKKLPQNQLAMDQACFNAHQPAFAYCKDNLCQLSR